MSNDADALGAILADLTVTKKATGCLVGDIYAFLKESGVTAFQRWRIKGGAQALHSKLKRYRMVKTILSLEKPVDLRSFYYPVHTRRGVIHDVDSFGTSANVLVLGYVGQGKSILMRYWCDPAVK